MLVVRAATLSELKLLAEQVCGQLRAFSIMHVYSPITNIVTVSAGYSVLSCHDHDDFERLIKESDSALYLAKKEGRNQVQEFRR